MPRRRRAIPPSIVLGTGLWLVVVSVWAGLMLAPRMAWLALGAGAFVAAVATALAAREHWRDASQQRARLSGRRARRHARRAARETARIAHAALIDGVDTPVICTDAGGMVTICNHAAIELVPTRDGDPRGRPIEDLFTKGELLAMHEKAAEGERAHGRIRLVVADAQRIFEVGVSPLADPVASNSVARRDDAERATASARRYAAGGDGARRRHGVAITLRDVTEIATAMQLKTDFVANASHELRTPLAAIRGAIETLRELGEGNPGVSERLVRMIGSNAQRLEELVSDLLDLSRLESPEMRVELAAFDAREMASSLAPIFDRRCAERGLELAFEIPPELESLTSDRPLIELILKNLIDNATKFARDHTKIRVRAEVLPPEEPGTDRGVRFEVIDRGIGIPLEHQQRVFERFYQVDSSRAGSGPQRGTGLGLAIVKHAIRVLGGRIGLESIWQEGTRVWFVLPDCVPASEGERALHDAGE